MSSSAESPVFSDCTADPVVMRLPVELLITCLYAADLPTRVRASHISRAWRELTLGERGLWTDYHLDSFPKDERAKRSSLEFLGAVLSRSDPLPFCLHYPYQPIFQNSRYPRQVSAVVRPHLQRLQAYEGSEHVFACLNPDNIPMPIFRSLALIEPSINSLGDMLMLTDLPSLRCLTTLHRLVAPIVNLQEETYPTVQEIVCTVQSVFSEELFRCFPNLVRAEFYGRRTTRLPRGPLPRTIREIIIPLGQPKIPGLDFAALRAWSGERIPRLTLIGVFVLEEIIQELLAAHSEPVRLAIDGGQPDIILSDAAVPHRWSWAVTMREFWGSMRSSGELQRLFTDMHIVALSLHVGRLGAFLAARLEAPHLETLELRLTGSPDGALSDTDFLRAPHLQHLVLDVGGTHADVRVHLDDINAVLEVLRPNLRALIVYDAELLDTVTIRTTTSRIAEIDCGSFAQFAQRYVEVSQHGSLTS